MYVRSGEHGREFRSSSTDLVNTVADAGRYMTDDSTFDPVRELSLARAVLANEAWAISLFADRLRCVPRIMTAQNGRMGRPLDEHDLADLVQDAVVVILQKLHLFGGRAPLEGWIYRICCLEFMNGMRRKRRRPSRFDSAELQVEDDGARRAQVALTEREELYNALARVQGIDAEAVVLKHFEGLTFKEMGARVGVSPNTMKARYYRGLSELERILDAKAKGPS